MFSVKKRTAQLVKDLGILSAAPSSVSGLAAPCYLGLDISRKPLGYNVYWILILMILF